MIRRAFVFAVACLAMANTSLAQPKEPIGRFAADARIASAGLPVDEGWTPAVPTTTVIPSRGLGGDFGAHVYVLRVRRAVFGVGASLLAARATSTPTLVEGSTPTVNTIPDVTTRVTALAPQVSLNFGHSLGWSYVSAGLGRAKVESQASLAGNSTTFTPRDSGWVKALNWGGGARWFVNDRVGFGFDVRWHKLNPLPATNTGPGAPRVSFLVAGAGVVLK